MVRSTSQMASRDPHRTHMIRINALRSIIIILAFVCVLTAQGCGTSTPPQVQGVVRSAPAAASASANVPGNAAGQGGATADLSVPRFEPKPVVWREDYQEANDLPVQRSEAKALMSRADRLKSAGEYEAAEKAYQQAISADASWGYPCYQLACNFELSGQHDRAVEQYRRAVSLGFDDFPTALQDDELGAIRKLPDFPATLVSIREKYLASREGRVGQPIALHAISAKPPEGYPMMLLLHGYGDTNLNYLDNADEWAELGFIAVAVPGSVPSSDGRFQWSADSIDPTHQDLQAIVNSEKFVGLVNPKKIYLLGFSQGALHALLLAAQRPEQYAGVVALSPGGSLSEQMGEPPLKPTQRPANIFFIHGDREPHAPYVTIWSNACSRAGWKFDSQTHSGGHHFPENWNQIRPRVARFLAQ